MALPRSSRGQIQSHDKRIFGRLEVIILPPGNLVETKRPIECLRAVVRFPDLEKDLAHAALGGGGQHGLDQLSPNAFAARFFCYRAVPELALIRARPDYAV